LQRLEEQRVADLREIEIIEERKREEGRTLQAVEKAASLLSEFLDPATSDSQLVTSSTIRRAILELSQFLHNHEVQLDEGLKQEMGDIVTRAERKVKNSETTREGRVPFLVEDFLPST